MNKKQKKMLFRILLTALLLAILGFIPSKGALRFFLYLIPYLLIGYDILRKAWRGILRLRVLDESFLMAAATLGALLLGVLQSGDYLEAVAVMLFYQVGELFQGYAVGKSRRSIQALMQIRPDTARVERDGAWIEVAPEEVAIGSLIAVYPGERIPIDGQIEVGTSSVNTAALTGESFPRNVDIGDEVLSGCINLTGVIHIRTNKRFEESTVAKILELVEHATSRKSKSEHFIAKFARIYTPAVCLSALALAILPPLASLALARAPQWLTWLYRALSFLVASCPCALLISIPLTFFAGIGGAGRQGILIKGSNYLEALAKTNCVVWDKTGTLTEGSFAVEEISHAALPQEELLYLAAAAEQASTHPIAEGLRRACQADLTQAQLSSVRELGGNGVLAEVDGRAVAVGNEKLMTSLGIKAPVSEASGTVVHIAADGAYAGQIRLADRIKDGAKEAIADLRRRGISRHILLTGDRTEVGTRVARELNISEAYGGLLPSDKLEMVENILSRRSGRATLAFVGDGINDAPVLSRADLGIAMGAMGSDAAIEAADIVLMKDDPRDLGVAVSIAKKCMSIVYQNIVFSIAVKLLALVLVGIGAATMGLAVFADVGVLILAVLNSMRALEKLK